jgi:hypothetical protein
MDLRPIHPDNYQKGLARGGRHAKLVRRATVATYPSGGAVVDFDSLAWRALKITRQQGHYWKLRPGSIGLPRRLPVGATERWGPVLWDALHLRAAQMGEELYQEAERKWIGAWISAVPCGDCRKHAIELLMAFPPDLSSGDAYRRWTIEFHNLVNERLGKPRMELPKAVKYWNSRLANHRQQSHTPGPLRPRRAA